MRLLGVVGGVLSLALFVGVLVGRFCVVRRLDEVTLVVEGGIDKGRALLGAAAERVDGAKTFVASIRESVRVKVAEAGDSERIRSLRTKAADLAARYGEIRAAYADARERVVSVSERLHALDQLLPVSFPQGPAEALVSIDAELRTLDAKWRNLLDALQDPDAEGALPRIEESADGVGSALTTLSGGLSTTGSRLVDLKARIDSRMAGLKSLVTWTAIVLALVFLYALFLHVVLYKSGRRAATSASGNGG